MTHRQELFIQEYIKTGNATSSAIKAGYSKRTAKSIGCIINGVDGRNFH